MHCHYVRSVDSSHRKEWSFAEEETLFLPRPCPAKSIFFMTKWDRQPLAICRTIILLRRQVACVLGGVVFGGSFRFRTFSYIFYKCYAFYKVYLIILDCQESTVF